MELEFIRWLEKRLPRPAGLPLGIGDDAAVFALEAGHQGVVTVDVLTDGVDFELAEISARRIGRKALAVNLSDIAAMAGRPLAGVVGLALPRAGALELAKELYEGLIPLAEQYDLVIAGGDTNTWDGRLVISVTLIGQVPVGRALTRAGATPGDSILVTGQLGGSILGHHFDFEPRVAEALWLAERGKVKAGMDISDGLSLDLWRMTQAGGLGAELIASKIPVSAAAADLARADGRSALGHALSDGEDFELLLAAEPGVAAELEAAQPLECGLTVVGRFVVEPGLWLVDEDGGRTPIEPRGFQH
ncbi:MAG TPA: thiamine-phosphate kinase [Pirellulales bacterium]|jgi:thiamine-monophosphate kinase